MTIKLFIYKIFYFLVFCIYFPYLLCKTVVQRKSFRALCKRLFPDTGLLPRGENFIWAHAVSVGEVVAIAPVLRELREAKNDVQIILSTVTETGFATARKLVAGVTLVYFPFDFAFCVRRLLQDKRPTLVLLSEGDVWPVFLHEMRNRGAQIALVNGKMSDGTFAWFQRFPGLGRWLYSFIDLFCVQDQIMEQRFIHVGAQPERLHVTGNTKTDSLVEILSEEASANLRQRIKILPKDRLIVLGSTHHSEEDLLVEALLPNIQEGLKVVIVPRHPERAQRVFEDLRRKYISLKVALFSSSLESWDVLVVDRLGMLTDLYQIAHGAIVCGSFLESVGGHNILEPATFGVPTIVGPFMHAQKALFKSATEQGAVIQVHPSDLAVLIRNMFSDEETRASHATRAKNWAASQRGSSKKTIKILNDTHLFLSEMKRVR